MTSKRALLSVSDKTGLIDFARGLLDLGYEILSTGGTKKTLAEAGLQVTDVSGVTGFPEIMDGRVKTLHPKIHGGLLGRSGIDDAIMNEHDIINIDVVAVNLYPFKNTVDSGADVATCIENIDIGGPAMVRASAKNHERVSIVIDPNDYKDVLEQLKIGQTIEQRRTLAGKAYAHTAAYDAMIARWFADQNDVIFPRQLTISGEKAAEMRYGENPHQRAALYITDPRAPSVVNAHLLQGKEMSFNNYNDADAALSLVQDFGDSACVIVKHANPCGVAVAQQTLQAYKLALRCDPVSAFGGILAFNRVLDGETAEDITKLFAEVIIAPDFTDEARAIFAAKKNLRVLQSVNGIKRHSFHIQNLEGGFLIQDSDPGAVSKSDMRVASQRQPTEQEWNDMLFALTVCKHVKSNAIVFAKNGATVGIGAGQMSRLDSTRIAAWKAREASNEGPLLSQGAVVASDAFYPFADAMLEAAKAGITAVIHPGGSLKDDEVLAAADEAGLAVVLTGRRHFRH